MSSLVQSVFKSWAGMSLIRDKASWKEFHLVDVGTINFFPQISSTISEATVERLAFVQRAAHFAVALLYTDFESVWLDDSHLSMLLHEIKLSVCEAHLKCGERENCSSVVPSNSSTSVKTTPSTKYLV